VSTEDTRDTQDTTVNKAVTTIVPTGGDVAPAAAAPGEEIDVQYIPYPTPGDEKTDQIGAFIGAEHYLNPPEDPARCWQIYQLSPYLEPHIAAIDANVYSSGYEVLKDEELDCDAPQLKERVEESLQFQASASPSELKKVPEGRVDAHVKKLADRVVWETRYLKRFFAACSPEMPFQDLLVHTGQDVEVTGNAYWEVLRDKGGRIARFIWSPSKVTRALPLTQADRRVAYEQVVRDPVLGFFSEPQFRTFRRYGQLAKDQNAIQCYFKSFGDPRVMSRKTGLFYQDLETMQQIEPTVLPATEIFHFTMAFAGSTVYGKPTWSGIWPSLEGSRDLDEENLKFIKDEVLPSLLLLVAGPRIHKAEIERFKQQITDRAKEQGRGILLLNAYGQQTAPGVPTQAANMLVERMKSEQINEAIFSRYDERAQEKAHFAFRLPAIALGVAGKRMDKTIALVLRRFAEDQVYTPKRTWLSRNMNVILDHMRVQCMRFSTNSVPPRDPESLAKIIQVLMEAGVLTPDEGRNLSEVIFNTRFENLPGVWSTLPTKLLIAVLQTKNPTLAAALLQKDETISLEKLSEILQKGLSDAAGQVQEETDDGPKEPGDTGDGDTNQ
jgi:capsid portal protein